MSTKINKQTKKPKKCVLSVITPFLFSLGGGGGGGSGLYYKKMHRNKNTNLWGFFGGWRGGGGSVWSVL